MDNPSPPASPSKESFKKGKKVKAPVLSSEVKAGETVRLVVGVDGAVCVPGEDVRFNERVGAKRSASGREPRWCPVDQVEAGGCAFGEKCAYAHVVEGAKEVREGRDADAKLMPEVRIILVEPQDSRNVGSVARLAANYGVDDVWIVSQRQLGWEEKRNKRVKADPAAHPMLSTGFFRYAEMLATPEGLPLLHGFHIVPEFKDALVGIDKAVAFTGKRGGTFRTMTVDVPGIVPLFAGRGGSSQRLALVFGNEAMGLSSNDTLLCSHVCTLPTSAYCTSLNLSHSVAVVLSRLWEELHGTEPPAQGHVAPDHIPAPEAEVAGLFEHCREQLAKRGHPCSPEDWTGNSRRKNMYAYRCHKHVTSLVHLAQVCSF